VDLSVSDGSDCVGPAPEVVIGVDEYAGAEVVIGVDEGVDTKFPEIVDSVFTGVDATEFPEISFPELSKPSKRILFL
jgi:hypothetical protein